MLITENDIARACKQTITEILTEKGEDFGLNVKGELTKDVIKTGVPLYHRPKDSTTGDPLATIKNLMRRGFSREYTGSNGGNMYGPGVYNVYNIESCRYAAKGYGKYIVKSYLLGGYKNFLIFNKDMAKEVYGNDWWIGTQIKKLFPTKLANELLNRFKLYMNDNATLGIRTSNIAVAITNYLGRRIEDSKVRGIIYSGGHDGCCAFVRNFSEVTPFYYSADNGRTWIEGITDELVYRAGHETDVEATLRNVRDEKGEKAFDDTANRSINGYVIMYKGKKANYYEVAKNQLISDVWFDYAGNFSKEGEAEVMYNGKSYTIQKDGDNYIVIDDEMGPLCLLEDLPNNC